MFLQCRLNAAAVPHRAVALSFKRRPRAVVPDIQPIFVRRSSSSGTSPPSAPTAPKSNESALALARRLISKRGSDTVGANKAGAAPAGPTADGAIPLTGVALARLWELIKPEAVPLSAAVATLVVTTGVSLFFPYAIGQLLDSALVTSLASSGVEGAAVASAVAPAPSSLAALGTPTTISLGLLGLFVAQSGLITARSALLSISGERMAASLRKQLFRAVLAQEVAWFDGHRTGDVLNRLSADAGVLQKALTSNVANGLRSAAMAVGGTAMLFSLSPTLALLSLGLIPPVALAGMAYGRYLQGQQRAVQEALGTTTAVAEEAVSGLRTVRSFAAEGREAARYSRAVDDSYAFARRIGVVAAYFDGAVHMAANVSLIAVLWYGGHLIADGSMTPGGLTSFLMLSLYTGFNVSALSTVYSELKRAAGAAARVFEVTDRVPSMPLAADSESFWAESHTAALTLDARSALLRRDADADAALEARAGYRRVVAATATPPLPATPDIVFTDVTFAYPTRPDVRVLDGFNLRLPAGRTVALVGPSGCGKSTVAALLQRLYDPQGGSVSIGGADLRSLDPAWLRGSVVAAVHQEPTLFSCSVADNIRYGRPAATRGEVEAAARAAAAHDFIAALPEGYDTTVGERGLQLSGGQRQRVAIARALLRAPRVAIFDEATSALDAESEAAAAAAVERLAAGSGTTVLVIAHRLSTMQRADIVAVVTGGRVVESGPFDVLFHDPRSAFRLLVDKQLLAAASVVDRAASIDPVVDQATVRSGSSGAPSAS